MRSSRTRMRSPNRDRRNILSWQAPRAGRCSDVPLHDPELNRPLNSYEYGHIEFRGRAQEALSAAAKSFPGGIEARACPSGLHDVVRAVEESTGLSVRFFSGKGSPRTGGFLSPSHPQFVFLTKSILSHQARCKALPMPTCPAAGRTRPPALDDHRYPASCYSALCFRVKPVIPETDFPRSRIHSRHPEMKRKRKAGRRGSHENTR